MTAFDPIDAVRSICNELVTEVTVLPTGHIRIQTALQYPDTGFVDVFIRRDAQLDLRERLVLSDFGNTTALLLDHRIKPWLSEKRKEFLREITQALGVTLNGGALEIELVPGQPLAQPILRLAQACLRMADLTFTQRRSVETTFRGDVEEFFSTRDIEYDPDYQVPLINGRAVRVDYRASGGPKGALVLTLGSRNAAAAHTVATELFSRWFDIRELSKAREARVTVVSDEAPVRTEDLDRLRKCSDVYYFSDEAGLGDALAA